MWLGVAAGTVGTAFGLRKRFSGDSVAVAENTAKKDIIARLQLERDKAQQERDEAIGRERVHLRTIGSLELHKALLIERLEIMEKDIGRIKRLLLIERPELTEWLSSDYAPMPSAPDKE